MSRLYNDLSIAEEIAKIEQAYAEIELKRALKISAEFAAGAASACAMVSKPMVSAAAKGAATPNLNAASDSKHSAEVQQSNQVAPPSGLVVDYWPSWSSNWTRDDLRNTPDAVNVVNIAFALPDGKGGILWNDDIHPACTKEVIKILQKKGKSVLIAIGGATAQSWNLGTVNIDAFAKNIKTFVDAYNLNGVDIDYEMHEHRDKLPDLIKALRKLMPKDKYFITYAGWSIGAFGVKGHEHPEWNSNPNKGNEIAVLSQVKDLLDWVNVMSYDAFDPTMKPAYDPRQAILAFSALMGNKPDKVTLGILVGKQSWPKDIVVKAKEVEPWAKFAKEQLFRGLMFWTLKNDVAKETGDPTGSFVKLAASLKQK